MKPEFSWHIFEGKKTPKYQIWWKIRPVGGEMFHADRQPDRHMTKLIVAFRNFANAPKYETKCSLKNELRIIVISDREGKSFVDDKTGSNSSIKRCLFWLLNRTRQAITWAAGGSTERRATWATVSSALRRAGRRYKILCVCVLGGRS